MKTYLKLLPPILSILLGTFALVYFGAIAPEILPGWFSGAWIDNPFVDAKLKYQLVTFGLALAVLAVVVLSNPVNARRFFKPGHPNAFAGPIRWLDIKPTDRWGKVGATFAVIVSLATATFIYFSLAQGHSIASANLRYLPFVLLLAAMNAFTEEAITRLGVVTALDGFLARRNL